MERARLQSVEKFEAIVAFEPREVRRVVALLEAQEIPFDLQADNSALSNPVRAVQLSMGIYPEGPKIVVFVPEADYAAALEAISVMFPVL